RYQVTLHAVVIEYIDYYFKVSRFFSVFFIIRRRRRSTLFPYTTLFRSGRQGPARPRRHPAPPRARPGRRPARYAARCVHAGRHRSEEHTSELQSRGHLVCRLLLEKKKYDTRLL